MRACTIEIITESEGTVSRFNANATCSVNGDGESVCYVIDGDEGEFSFRDGGCAMRRQGKNGLSVRFCPNEETELTLQSDGFSGSVPVQTTFYKLIQERNARIIELSYRLAGSAAVTEYNLHIQINFFSEEK